MDCGRRNLPAAVFCFERTRLWFRYDEAPVNSLGINASAASPILSLVICTLNEAAAIGPLLAEIGSALEGVSHEIIVVDDDSADGTAQVVAGLAEADPSIRLIVRTGVRGLASAAVAGWDVARGNHLALMDGDGQHDPALLPRLLDALDAGDVDVAIGARNLANEAQALSTGRLHLSRAGVWLAGLVLGARLSDPLSGYFVMTRAFYTQARPRLSAVGFKILVDLVASSPMQVRFIERPTALRERRGGQSKLDARVIADLGALLIEKKLGGLIPARFVLFSGVGVSGVVVNLGVLAVLRSLCNLPFIPAQGLAILTAMGSNFLINNLLTFRDQRLRGWALGQGFLAFVLACALGAVFNWSASVGLHQLLGWPSLIAAAVSAVLAGVFNFWAVRRVTWSEARA